MSSARPYHTGEQEVPFWTGGLGSLSSASSKVTGTTRGSEKKDESSNENQQQQDHLSSQARSRQLEKYIGESPGKAMGEKR